MKTPMIILTIGTAIMFIVAIATGFAASKARDLVLFDSSEAQTAANLTSASDVSLTIAGVGLVGLLVAWAVLAGLREHSALAAALAATQNSTPLPKQEGAVAIVQGESGEQLDRPQHATDPVAG